METILGIETSCDETSAAVVRDGRLLSNVTKSQLEHVQFGGVVPELASRAHQRYIIPVVKRALSDASITVEDLTGVAAVFGPGLVGALIVGLNFAKSLAVARRIPFVGINHLQAHLYSNFLEEDPPEYPYVALIVSGGHTILVHVTEKFRHTILGASMDDAAGEAFDKVAKMLGLPYPGGPSIEHAASSGNPMAVRFPRYAASETYDFSFSGVKTSVLYYLRRFINPTTGTLSITEQERSDVAASFQSAAVEMLVKPTVRAALKFGVSHVSLAGGVAANKALQNELRSELKKHEISLHIPSLAFCTDNGAMVGYLGSQFLTQGVISPLNLGPAPSLSLVESAPVASVK